MLSGGPAAAAHAACPRFSRDLSTPPIPIAPNQTGAVRCNASLQQQAKKAAAAIAAAPALLAASPAFAIVDERLNGDGTGLPFGVNDPTLGWVIVGVAGLVWGLYFVGQRDFGDFEDPDSGLDRERAFLFGWNGLEEGGGERRTQVSLCGGWGSRKLFATPFLPESSSHSSHTNQLPTFHPPSSPKKTHSLKRPTRVSFSFNAADP